jgi:hypothetical protein
VRQFWHQLGDFGMDVFGGGRSGGTRVAATLRIERLRDL